MKTAKLKVIWDPVYRCDVMFISGCSFDDLVKAVKKRGLKAPLESMRYTKGATALFTEQDNPGKVQGTIFLVWVQDKKDFYTLLHEVSHLVQAIFDVKGIEISWNNGEPFSYYQEFWFKTLWRLTNKK